MRHFICLSLLTLACVAHAADGVVALIGVIGNKAAVLSLDGGDPKTVKLGQTWNGISVLAVEKDGATIELKGEKRLLHIGQHYRSEASVAAGAGRDRERPAEPGRPAARSRKSPLRPMVGRAQSRKLMNCSGRSATELRTSWIAD